jgi:D-alanyl-D-alanine carboxypeptidase
MLRIGIGAPQGLRLGAYGLLAAVLTLTSTPSRAAPYADIVVDANSGNVLHETNPDALRHPASLTKIMTLYLLFEQLDSGKLKLDSPLNVSTEAASQMPTKLGLKSGSTIQVEDAIKGMVTRSANDAAVVVAEAVGGDETEFAKLMTRKAQALGMAHTVYRNASGLPNDAQVTTARDQALLGRAIQERFPRYYRYFATRSFTFHGQSIGNHNNLLGRVEGVDGIKTGYISASGFNLVTSVHRGNRYLVAVVLGGSSAGSRDSRMRELISEKIAQASTKRTAPMVAEASRGSDARGEPKVVAKSEAEEAKRPAKIEAKTASKSTPKTEPKADSKIASKADSKTASKTEAKTESKTEPKTESKTDPEAETQPEPRFEVASAANVPVDLPHSVPPTAMAAEPATTPAAQSAPAVGSTDPIRPVLVKTLTVRAAGTQTASVSPLRTPSASSAEPITVEQQPSPVAVATVMPSTMPAASLARAPIAPPTRAAAMEVAPAATANEGSPAEEELPAAAATKTQLRGGWIIQVGAYQAEREAKQRLSAVQSKASKMLTGADPFTETFDKGGTTYYRARFAGLDKDKAEAACKYLKRNDVECVTIKN